MIWGKKPQLPQSSCGISLPNQIKKKRRKADKKCPVRPWPVCVYLLFITLYKICVCIPWDTPCPTFCKQPHYLLLFPLYVLLPLSLQQSKSDYADSLTWFCVSVSQNIPPGRAFCLHGGIKSPLSLSLQKHCHHSLSGCVCGNWLCLQGETVQRIKEDHYTHTVFLEEGQAYMEKPTKSLGWQHFS